MHFFRGSSEASFTGARKNLVALKPCIKQTIISSHLFEGLRL